MNQSQSELARQLAEMKIPRQQQQAHRKQHDPAYSKLRTQCVRKDSERLPAHHPTPSKPPVAELIAPDIGGPPSAPNAAKLRNNPVRRPTSPMAPMAMAGTASRETYVPHAKLSQGTGTFSADDQRQSTVDGDTSPRTHISRRPQ